MLLGQPLQLVWAESTRTTSTRVQALHRLAHTRLLSWTPSLVRGKKKLATSTH